MTFSALPGYWILYYALLYRGFLTSMRQHAPTKSHAQCIRTDKNLISLFLMSRRTAEPKKVAHSVVDGDGLVVLRINVASKHEDISWSILVINRVRVPRPRPQAIAEKVWSRSGQKNQILGLTAGCRRQSGQKWSK